MLWRIAFNHIQRLDAMPENESIRWLMSHGYIRPQFKYHSPKVWAVVLTDKGKQSL